MSNVPAFVENVIRFPLGLAGVTSPAASPLLGHLLVTLLPHLHRVVTVAIVAVGGLAMVYVLVRHTPRTPWELSRLLGWAMLGAIVLAPSTRVGYALYPIDFLVWAWMLRSEERHDLERGEVVAVAEAVLGAADERHPAAAGGTEVRAVARAGGPEVRAVARTAAVRRSGTGRRARC